MAEHDEILAPFPEALFAPVRVSRLVAEHDEILAPYPGLRPFEFHEATIFFGRERHIERLFEILKRERFLAVIGPSGCGKSSLVRAGMLPALAAGWMGTGGDWRIATLRPGDRPLHQLARSLISPRALGAELLPDGLSSPAYDDGHATAPIEAELRRGPLGLIHLVEDARRRAPERPLDLLVLVDQFEEIFRYVRRGPPQADESDAFVDLLLESCRVPDARVYVVLAMRSDFLGSCVRFLELPDAINRGQYLTPRLTRDQLAAAIAEPARVFGGEVEPTLANDLINAISGDPDQLPILQHALARMWEVAVARSARSPLVTRDDLAATGGIQDTLSRHADAVFQALDAPLQPLAEHLFRAITDGRGESGGRDTRRPQKLDDIAAAAGGTWQDFAPVVEAFAREGVNFLTYVPPLDGKSRIDIAHEALIRQWHRLLGWVAGEFERATDYRRWRDRALEWESGGELLAGTDLARARDWLEGTAARWQPTAPWAARYALSEGTAAREEFDRTVQFIQQSTARELELKRAAERAETEMREREREAARLARQRIRDLERVIREIPDEARRRALAKKYLPDSIKQLSKSQEKRLSAKLKAGAAGRARPRVPPQHGLKLWENGASLRVRFMGGTAAQHKKVRQRAPEWTRYANLRFEFGSATDAEIRIAFEPDGGSWAYIGTDALAISPKEPTMNLGWVEENVLHEFGHVLGLIHETNNPNAKLKWNKPVVYRELSGPPNYWSKEQINNTLFARYKGIKYRAFDAESIMSYAHPASWFLDGREIKGGKSLSESDKRFIGELYPPSPPPSRRRSVAAKGTRRGRARRLPPTR